MSYSQRTANGGRYGCRNIHVNGNIYDNPFIDRYSKQHYFPYNILCVVLFFSRNTRWPRPLYRTRCSVLFTDNCRIYALRGVHGRYVTHGNTSRMSVANDELLRGAPYVVFRRCNVPVVVHDTLYTIVSHDMDKRWRHARSRTLIRRIPCQR